MDSEPNASDDSGDLVLGLEGHLPDRLPCGSVSALFLIGYCYHPEKAVTRLEVVSDDLSFEVENMNMPRPDVASVQEPPVERALLSGFWASVPLTAPLFPGTIRIGLRAGLEDGSEIDVPAVSIEAVEEVPIYQPEKPLSAPGLAICMATYEPDPDLFSVQIESIRNQTATDWICLISDDCSGPESLAKILDEVGGDPRFIVSPSPERLGFYRNFERSLKMVPPSVELIALSDQDDRWYPDKLESLRSGIGPAHLIYSDQRLTDASGAVLAETLWIGRRNNHTNLASMIIANTVTGAASMFRRRLLDQLLPFPDPPGWQFHDQWISMTALSTGDIAYLDRPLYDYVQHRGAILGQVSGEFEGRRGIVDRLKDRLRPWKSVSTGWRAAYFFDVLRVQNQAATLIARSRDTMPPDKLKVLRRFENADRSRATIVWLLLRPLRSLAGRTETLGTESEFARGLLWRRLTSIRSRRSSGSADAGPDASVPPGGPGNYGSGRLKRWRAG